MEMAGVDQRLSRNGCVDGAALAEPSDLSFAI